MSRLKEFIDPLFRFRKNVLNPVLADIAGKIEAARKTQNPGERAEQLLTVGEEAKGQLSDLAGRETSRNAVGLSGMVAGFVLAIGWAAAAALSVATAAGAAALSAGVAATASLPTLGLGLMALGGWVMCKHVYNGGMAHNSGKEIEETVGNEVLALAEASPQEVIKSPRFMKSLAISFKGATGNSGTAPAAAPALIPKPAAPANGGG